MGNDQTICVDGILNTQRFLNSLGFYGNTPFLYPLYGNGEISQYFCRMCAVFGGIYCLKTQIHEIIMTTDSIDNNKTIMEDGDDTIDYANITDTPLKPSDEGDIVQTPVNTKTDNELRFTEIYCGKQKISAKHLVMSYNYAPKEYFDPITNAEYVKLLPKTKYSNDVVSKKTGISRAIFITDRSIAETDREHVTFLRIPPLENNSETVVLELGSCTYVCPDDLYVVHMTCPQTVDAKTDLKFYVEQLFNNEECEEPMHKNKSTDETLVSDTTEAKEKNTKPRLLWSLYFNMHNFTMSDFDSMSKPLNVHLCSGPDLDLDYDYAVKQAKTIFLNMYPDCDFLPRAPDPEQIIFDEPSENDISACSKQSETNKGCIDIDNSINPLDGAQNSSNKVNELLESLGNVCNDNTEPITCEIETKNDV